MALCISSEQGIWRKVGWVCLQEFSLFCLFHSPKLFDQNSLKLFAQNSLIICPNLRQKTSRKDSQTKSCTHGHNQADHHPSTAKTAKVVLPRRFLHGSSSLSNPDSEHSPSPQTLHRIVQHKTAAQRNKQPEAIGFLTLAEVPRFVQDIY